VVICTCRGTCDRLTSGPAVYGQGRNFKKSSGYAPHPYFPTVSNTHNTIDKAVHGRKRRIVSQGFSESVLVASEPYILQHVDSLCKSLVEGTTGDPKRWSPPRDMALWSKIPLILEITVVS
jgi:cytochrome P450